MSKKMKILASVLVAIILLTVGGTTIALAQDDEELEEDELTTEEVEVILPDEESDSLLARVAEILGISEEELRDIFRQAREEMIEERFDETFYSMLDKAVEEGLLSDDEAQEIREWWEEKPEALTPGLLQRAFCGGNWKLNPGLKLHLQKQLRQVSPEEVEAIKERQESRPEVSNAQQSRARIVKAFHARQQIAVPNGWQGQIPGETED